MKLSNNQLKYLKSLHLRKFRQKYHNFIVEGAKMAEETLLDKRWQVEGIFAVQEWLEDNAALLSGFSEKITAVTPAELKKISLLSTPNAVLLVVRQPDYEIEEAEVQTGLSLYLEDIQDPGNLGAILRIADWFGIRWVFCSEGCVEVFNPKVVQASMGAFLRVKSVEIALPSLISSFPILPVYGAVLDGKNIFETRLSEPALLVIGNESKGISSPLEKFLTHRISIPRHKLGKAESLNAAVAAGILCAVFRNAVK